MFCELWQEHQKIINPYYEKNLEQTFPLFEFFRFFKNQIPALPQQQKRFKFFNPANGLFADFRRQVAKSALQLGFFRYDILAVPA